MSVFTLEEMVQKINRLSQQMYDLQNRVAALADHNQCLEDQICGLLQREARVRDYWDDTGR